jgi:hypothetical protein
VRCLQECDHYWAEVTNGMYWFGRKHTLADVLRSGTVTRESLLQFFDAYLTAAGPQRRKFSSQFYGKGRRYVKATAAGGSGAAPVVVGEPVEFRRSLPLYPVPQFAPV